MAGREAIIDAPLGEKTTIAGTESFPIGGSQYALISSVLTYMRGVDNSYEVHGGFASSAPADATTYYFGCFPHIALSTTNSISRMYIMRAGTVCAADVFIICTAGSNETSTMSMRLNNTTDTTLSAGIALNATPFHVQNTALSVAVAVGDYLEIKWVTPTWTTNPTDVIGIVKLFIK